MKLTSGRLRVLRGVKKFLYSQLYMRDSLLIMFGKSKPLVCFKVEDSPPSVYWNFEIHPEKVEVLERELELPFELAKLRILEGEEPRYYLTLNLYRVSGLANGIRAEWSVYIEDPHNAKPRYLVVEALSDQRSIDSIDLLTKVGRVSHEVSGDSLESQAESARGGRFLCTCRIPEKDEKADGDKPVRAAAEWSRPTTSSTGSVGFATALSMMQDLPTLEFASSTPPSSRSRMTASGVASRTRFLAM